MTPEESRENFIESLFDEQTLASLKERGIYNNYVTGVISVDEIYRQIRDQGI